MQGNHKMHRYILRKLSYLYLYMVIKMYSGALYIVPIVVFSVLYNINKFYEVNTAFLLDEMNNTVGTARDPIWPDCESGIGFSPEVASVFGSESSPTGSETLVTMNLSFTHSVTHILTHLLNQSGV